VDYTNDGTHHGIDLLAPKGKPVLALSNAYVVFSQLCSECTEDMPSVKAHIEAGKDVGNPFSNTAWNWGFGHLVVLRMSWDDLSRSAQRILSEKDLEGGYLYALYAHLSSIDAGVVRDGVIAAGAKVGEVGKTGNADGPHLHFELRAGAKGDTWAATNTVLINPLAVMSEY
jgi:murein DD-endopeptidase MepM/ murein hydrolase activator NlpD